MVEIQARRCQAQKLRPASGSWQTVLMNDQIFVQTEHLSNKIFAYGHIDGGCHDCVSGQLKDMEKAKEDREAQGQIEQCNKPCMFSV